MYAMKCECEQKYKMIGLELAYYRKLWGYTQKKLADKLGTATSCIGQIEASDMYKAHPPDHLAADRPAPGCADL